MRAAPSETVSVRVLLQWSPHAQVQRRADSGRGIDTKYESGRVVIYGRYCGHSPIDNTERSLHVDREGTIVVGFENGRPLEMARIKYLPRRTSAGFRVGGELWRGVEITPPQRDAESRPASQ